MKASTAYHCSKEFDEPRYNDIASITYTSGTTGVPKGAVIRWPYFFRFVEEDAPHRLPRDNQSCIYVPHPISWLVGQTALYKAAVAGCRVVLRESLVPSMCMSDISRHKCTEFLIPLPVAEYLMQQPPLPSDASCPLENVCLLGVPASAVAFVRRFNIKNVVYYYGMTEVGNVLISDDLSKASRPGLCGRPDPRYEIQIVDDDDEPVAANEMGQLVIRSRKPWRGPTEYFNMADETLAAFRNNWFHTGDAFVRDEDGDYFFVDRIDELICLTDGYVSSNNIQIAANSHRDVLQSAAVGVKVGEAEEEIKLFVQLKSGGALTAPELWGHLLAILPARHLPRWIEFLNEIPRTPSLKIRKSELQMRPHNAATWETKNGRIYPFA